MINKKFTKKMSNVAKKPCFLLKIITWRKILLFFLLIAITSGFSCSFFRTNKESMAKNANNGSNPKNMEENYQSEIREQPLANDNAKSETIILKLDKAIPGYLKTILKNKAKKIFDDVVFEEDNDTFEQEKMSNEAAEKEIIINTEILKADEDFSNYIIVCVVSNFFSPVDNIGFNEIEGFLNSSVRLSDNNKEAKTMDEEKKSETENNSKTPKILYISNDIGGIFKKFYGENKDKDVVFADNTEIFSQLSQNTEAIALIPFEDLEKDIKVLNIDGKSIFSKDFSFFDYPLSYSVGFRGNNREKTLKLEESFEKDFYSNMDPEKLATVNVTGVTALVRGVANRMDKKGILYPAEKIAGILKDADITHISNEISFKENCNAGQGGTTFCSKPEYIELLRFVGTDVVELTGNHLNDYGSRYLEETIKMYDEEGWKYFGGGLNLDLAREAALFEINGNKIAFLGFNQFGPSYDWATAAQAGSAPPDDQFYMSEIGELKKKGYNVIFTFQYEEAYQYSPLAAQIDDFRKMSSAGADIVSGSQAHHPMGFELNKNGLICYGLGNLFFDQMQSLGTRQGLIAKHVFYDNRYINTQFIPTLIEDYCQPRLMENAEKEEFLSIIYNKSIKSDN